ncbi:hypothetical protein AQUCO_00300870v1 [Aquilegia coerulea]|uniref:Peptidase A1 domain-containing protein n=1 Tax=Aquilegia coerulea TaxID=218851 RepID=A0A2G5F0Z1_AQUCA|nr:hypothetical protein AQUCO_00300870v1 [Aquilegia coerulea]
MVVLLVLQLVVSKCNGLTLKLIPRDSIESPLYPGNLTLAERAARLHNHTDARIKYYAARIATAGSAKLQVNQSEDRLQPEVVRPQISFQDYFYLAKVGIGTFNSTPLQKDYRNYFLMVDTGSDLIWTQCEPCQAQGCFPQVQPLFPFRRSRTYESFPCNGGNRFCYPNECMDDLCSYKIEYGTRQYTQGYLGKDRFAFEVNDGPTDSVYYIAFGCGINQRRFKWDTTQNQINGILGMGNGPHSLVHQLGELALGRFSYCVPRWEEPHDHIYLRFGQEARFRLDQHVLTTPLIVGGLKEAYYVKLRDISVAGNRFNYRPGYFDVKRDGTGGCIIDSGCPLTRLPQRAFTWLKNAVINYFAQAHLPPRPKHGFDLCFELPRPDQKMPLIRFHLQNADLTIEEGAFMHVDDAICLAFKSSSDLGGLSAVIGGLAQANYRFVFNVAASTVSFALENCTSTS